VFSFDIFGDDSRELALLPASDVARKQVLKNSDMELIINDLKVLLNASPSCLRR
jgi:septum formation inhibitor-activating ATPase MinD